MAANVDALADENIDETEKDGLGQIKRDDVYRQRFYENTFLKCEGTWEVDLHKWTKNELLIYLGICGFALYYVFERVEIRTAFHVNTAIRSAFDMPAGDFFSRGTDSITFDSIRTHRDVAEWATYTLPNAIIPTVQNFAMPFGAVRATNRRINFEENPSPRFEAVSPVVWEHHTGIDPSESSHFAREDVATFGALRELKVVANEAVVSFRNSKPDFRCDDGTVLDEFYIGTGLEAECEQACGAVRGLNGAEVCRCATWKNGYCTLYAVAASDLVRYSDEEVAQNATGHDMLLLSECDTSVLQNCASHEFVAPTKRQLGATAIRPVLTRFQHEADRVDFDSETGKLPDNEVSYGYRGTPGFVKFVNLHYPADALDMNLQGKNDFADLKYIVKDQFSELFSSGFLGRNSATFVIDFLTYHINFEMYCWIKFVFEFQPEGKMVISLQTDALPFSAADDDFTDFEFLDLQLLDWLFIGLFSSWILYEINKLRRKLISTWLPADCAFVLLVALVAVGVRTYRKQLITFEKTGKNTDFGNIVEIPEFTSEFETMAITYSGLQQNCSLLLLILCFRVIKYMSDAFPQVGVLSDTLRRASTAIFFFLFIIGVILIGFVSWGNVAFGVGNHDFYTLSNSLRTCLSWTFGKIDSFDALYNQFGWRLVLHFIPFMLVFYFVMVNFNNAILNAAYDASWRSADAKRYTKLNARKGSKKRRKCAWLFCFKCCKRNEDNGLTPDDEEEIWEERAFGDKNQEWMVYKKENDHVNKGDEPAHFHVLRKPNFPDSGEDGEFIFFGEELGSSMWVGNRFYVKQQHTHMVFDFSEVGVHRGEQPFIDFVNGSFPLVEPEIENFSCTTYMPFKVADGDSCFQISLYLIFATSYIALMFMLCHVGSSYEMHDAVMTSLNGATYSHFGKPMNLEQVSSESEVNSWLGFALPTVLYADTESDLSRYAARPDDFPQLVLRDWSIFVGQHPVRFITRLYDQEDAKKDGSSTLPENIEGIEYRFKFVRKRPVRLGTSIKTDYAPVLDPMYTDFDETDEYDRIFSPAQRGRLQSEYCVQANCTYAIKRFCGYRQGFVCSIPANKSIGENFLRSLPNNDFVSQQTATLVVDFVLYNANVNIFTYVSIEFTFPPSGAVTKIVTTQSMRLDMFAGPEGTLRQILLYLYMALVAYFIADELLSLVTEYKECKTATGICAKSLRVLYNHFKDDPYNFIDFISYGFSVVTIFTWFMYTRQKLVSDYFFLEVPVWKTCDNGAQFVLEDCGDDDVIHAFSELSGYFRVFIRFGSGNCLVICVRLLKFFRTHEPMQVVTGTLVNAAKSVMWFGLMLIVVLIGFVSMGHVAFGAQLKGFETYSQALRTCFRMVMGNFNFEELRAASPTMAPLFFYPFMLTFFFVLMNIFLAIIDKSFQTQLQLYYSREEKMKAIRSGKKTKRIWHVIAGKLKTIRAMFPSKTDDDDEKEAVKPEDLAKYELEQKPLTAGHDGAHEKTHENHRHGAHDAHAAGEPTEADKERFKDMVKDVSFKAMPEEHCEWALKFSMDLFLEARDMEKKKMAPNAQTEEFFAELETTMKKKLEEKAELIEEKRYLLRTGHTAENNYLGHKGGLEALHEQLEMQAMLCANITDLGNELQQTESELQRSENTYSDLKRTAQALIEDEKDKED